MPATYVKITRQELEDWLYDLCPVFQRDEQTEGIYLCPLSPHVAVKLSTTLGQTDAVIRVGGGRCRMSFVRREGGNEIRKPHDSSNASFQRCNRTQGWRDNWAEALRGMFASFKGDRDHYNRLGARTQEEYAKEWGPRIESVKNWESFEILRDLRDELQLGHWLTTKQENAVWKFVRPKRGTGKKRAVARHPKGSASRKTSGTVDSDLLDGLEALAAAAAKGGDEWTVKFATGNLRGRIKAGRAPSGAQVKVLREKFTKFGLTMPAAVAA